MQRRVAMICVHTSPLASLGGDKTGGMNVYIRELASALARRGWLVDVFTRASSHTIPQVEADVPGVRVISLRAGPLKQLSTRDHIALVPEFTQALMSFVEAESLRYDLVHSHYWLSGMVAESLRQAWGLKYVHMFHTLGRMKNRIANSPSEMEPPERIEGEDRLVRRADALVAATQAERLQQMWLYNADLDRIHVIPPGVDLLRFCPIPREEAREALCVERQEKMLLFVGRIEPLKGIETLLRAAAELKLVRPMGLSDLHVVIIGGTLPVPVDADSEMARMVRLTEELGLQDRVAFIGAQSQDRLPIFYSAAEVVVMPSHYESFGMVALEAMACGTPVIASEVGGLAYLVQEGVTGFRVPAAEHELLAARIAQLVDDRDLRQRMSRAALEYAQDYSWDRIAGQIKDLYEMVIAKGRS